MDTDRYAALIHHAEVGGRTVNTASFKLVDVPVMPPQCCAAGRWGASLGPKQAHDVLFVLCCDTGLKEKALPRYWGRAIFSCTNTNCASNDLRAGCSTTVSPGMMMAVILRNRAATVGVTSFTPHDMR